MNLEFRPSFEKEVAQLSTSNLKRVKKLILDILQHPFEGIGKPEPLKHAWTGCWSRRIDKKNRLIYQVVDNQLILLSCCGHY